MPSSIRTLIVGAFLGALSTLGMATAASPARHAEQLIDEARMELAEAQSLVDAAAHSQSARSRLRSSLSDLDGTLRTLDRTLDGPTGPQVVSSQDLSRIRSSIAAESFSDDRLAILRDASRGRYFTSAQVLSMMELFSFSDDKVEAAVILFPRVVDQQNWYTVYSGLTFSSDKDRLRAQTR